MVRCPQPSGMSRCLHPTCWVEATKVIHHHHHSGPVKSVGTAVALELGPGFLIQTFGIGNLYAGNVGIGLALMFGYWIVTAINFVLCFLVIGFFTWPLCWLFAMILSPILAAKHCEKVNAQGHV